MKSRIKIVLIMAAAMSLIAASVPAYAKVITYTPTSTSTKTVEERVTSVSTNSSKEVEAYGPGYQLQNTEEQVIEEETAAFTGPSVKKVTLTETYHELYDTYEEGISDTYFLYTNVSNGGLTHEPVMIDIPANVDFSMEKDGVPYSYTSGQYVQEKGTYVLRITAIENPDLPFSEQTEYQAVFRFRIQDEPPKTEESADVEQINNPYDAMVDISELIQKETLPKNTEAVVEETMPDETKTVEETEAVTEAETTPEATTESVETSLTEEAVEESAAEQETDTSVLREQSFNTETGIYTIKLENGKQLMINVEDNYKGPGPVQFAVAEEDLPLTSLYRGDEKITMNSNSRTVTENGKYTIAMSDENGTISTVVFTIPYQLNFYGILAIGLIILVIAGVVAFVVLTKKNFKVR